MCYAHGRKRTASIITCISYGREKMVHAIEMTTKKYGSVGWSHLGAIPLNYIKCVEIEVHFWGATREKKRARKKQKAITPMSVLLVITPKLCNTTWSDVLITQFKRRKKCKMVACTVCCCCWSKLLFNSCSIQFWA